MLPRDQEQAVPEVTLLPRRAWCVPPLLKDTCAGKLWEILHSSRRSLPSCLAPRLFAAALRQCLPSRGRFAPAAAAWCTLGRGALRSARLGAASRDTPRPGFAQ